MDAIKQQLLRIQQQLNGLSASQKMLTVSLVVIMIMTMFYWSHYASSSEMEMLLDQSMSPDEISQITTSLSGKSIKYQVNGDRIMIPSDRKFEILAKLGYDQLLPHDMKSGFDEVIAEMSPLDPSAKTDQLFNHAKEKTLSMMISQWPNVRSATVMIDGNRRLSPVRSIQSTATVNIITKSDDAATKQLADAARNMVSGGQSGLHPEDISVNINGRSFKTKNADDALSDADNEILGLKSKYEDHYIDKILKLMAIPGAMATVSIDLKIQATVSTSHTVDPKAKVEVSTKQTTISTENTAPAASGEPGVVPNVGVDVAQTQSGQNSTYEKTETEGKNDTGYKNEETKTSPGDGIPVTASVRLPDSYFRRIWKNRNPTATKDPTDAEIDVIAQREISSCRNTVKMATNIKDDANVFVTTYFDLEEPVPQVQTAGGALANLPVSVGFGAKDIAVGALAVISLFMVSMMVRKSAPQAMLQPAMAGGGSDVSAAINKMNMGHNVAGEVHEVDPMLVGHELSDEAIESKQVIEQVGTMVKDNPEAAANLVKRWLNRE